MKPYNYICWVGAPIFGFATPSLVPTTGGVPITINGANFSPLITGTLNGVDLGLVWVSSGEVTGTVPPGAFGAGDLVLTNHPSGESVSIIGGVSYYAQILFGALPAGSMTAAALIAATGVSSFSRAQSGGQADALTVQKTASTIESAVSLNRPRIDDTGTIKGILLEQRMVNRVPTGGARRITVGWVHSALGAQTDFSATGPDGVAFSSSAIALAVGQISNYQDYGSEIVKRLVFSSWQRSQNFAVDGDMQQVIINIANTVASCGVRLATNTWGRIIKAKGATPLEYNVPCATYDYSGTGGQTARARAVYVDFMQLEPGDYASSAIDSSNAFEVVRPPDYLAWSIPTTDNRIRLYMKCYPIFGPLPLWTVNTASGLDTPMAQYFVYYIDADNYMYLNEADRKVYCKVAGAAELVSSDSIVLPAANSELELLLQLGNNVATYLVYRIGGAGAWTNLVMAAQVGNATPAGPATICNDSISQDGRPLACRLNELRAYPIEITVADI